MSLSFVKQSMLGEYTPVSGGQSDPECTHVIMSADEYDKLIRKYDELSAEHSNLIKKWNELVEDCNNHVFLSQKEYKGYKNALRIIKDRSLQQIDKSQADKHGYRLMRGEKRNYGKKGKQAYLITKSTPYSIKMDPQVVKDEILDDLRQYYSFIDNRTYIDTRCNQKRKRITPSKYCDGIEQKDDPQWADRDFYGSNDDEGRAIYQIFQEYNDVFIFEISKLSSNQAQGVYEITYWATDII